MFEKFFKLKENNTTAKTEIIAGLATFMTMAYILAVNPMTITGEMGGPLWNAVFLATALSAFVGTAIMGLYANRPLALAPGMGLNAYFATVVGGIAVANSITITEAMPAGLAIILFSGILFTTLTLLNIRKKIVAAIPKAIRIGIPAGIGMLLAFLGFKTAVYTADGAFTVIDFFTDGPAVMAAKMGNDYNQLILNVVITLMGLMIIAILSQRKVKGSILYGIIISSVFHWIGQFILGGNPFATLAGASFIPPFADMFELTFFKFDFALLFKMGMIPAIMTIVTFCMIDMFDTIGALLGTAEKADMLNEQGELPYMNKAMLSDSLATIAGATLGTSTVTTFIESVAGITVGGRTGLTAITTALLFLASIFIAPIAALIPGAATAPALVFLGVLMLSSVTQLDFDDMTQVVPVVLMLVMMPATGHIGDAMGLGLISYSIIKIAIGKSKDISILTLVLSAMFLVKFFLIF